MTREEIKKTVRDAVRKAVKERPELWKKPEIWPATVDQFCRLVVQVASSGRAKSPCDAKKLFKDFLIDRVGIPNSFPSLAWNSTTRGTCRLSPRWITRN